RCRRQAAWRGAVARRRQLPELALSRSREAAGAAARRHARALLLRPGRRREPDSLHPRGGQAHRARRVHRGRGLRRGGAIDRDESGARGHEAAVDAIRARRRGAEARGGIPEAAGGNARRVPSRHRLSLLRGCLLRALGSDAARGDGGIRDL
ncbi:hypothetical protein KXV85_004775, partial [Aspergillus fumigatus]